MPLHAHDGMSGRVVDTSTDETAVYTIHVAGLIGPMLVSSLFDTATAASGSWDVHTQSDCVILVSATDDDLVDIVRRLAADDVEIGCVRELGAGEPRPELPG